MKEGKIIGLVMGVSFCFLTGCGQSPSRVESSHDSGEQGVIMFSENQNPIGLGQPNSTPKQRLDSVQTDTCIDGETFICKIEAAIASGTNRQRAMNLGDGRLLTHSGELSYVARDWSMKQAQSGTISHSGFPYAREQVLRKRFPKTRISIATAAENVAMAGMNGNNAQVIARQFMNMWMNSSGHRDNILGNFTGVGVGVARVGAYWYATQIFYRR